MVKHKIPRSSELDPAVHQALIYALQYADSIVGGGGGVTAHNALTGLAADDHPQYHNNARGDARYDLIGTAATAVSAHAAAADPHTGYQKESEKGAVSGYASLDGSTKVPIAQIPTGATGTTVPFGNDARFTDTRTPTDNTVSTIKIVNDAVDNTKLNNMATQTIKGRNTAGTGDPEDLATATVAGMLSVGGDLTGTVASATVAANAVSNTKLADMATATFKGRTTAGSGDPEDLTATQATALLNVATTSLKGLVPAWPGTTTTFFRGDGTYAVPPNTLGSDGDKGDITVGGTGTTLTVDNNAVTNAKLNDMATASFKGRVTAGTGDPEDLTGTQATTLLDTFTSALKGLAPASGGGTANFLRADGTWAAPPAGGTADTLYNASTLVQTISGAADTYVTSSNLTIGARQKAGTIIKYRLGITKTGAGVAAPVFNVRFGTAGTTADTARWTSSTLTAQTAAADSAWVDITITCYAVNAVTGQYGVTFMMGHGLAATGFSTQMVQVATVSTASFDNTSASLIVGLSINPGASAAWTMRLVAAEATNLT